MLLLKAFPAVLLFLSTPLLAQGNGITLLSNKDEFTQYNDIWGYTAPNGDEYALIGTTGGTAVYNAVDPAAPYLTGFIPGPGSLWRDLKTFDHYAYVVTEGGGGVQIIDLANPEAPVLLKTWGAGIFTHSHDIAIDTDTGTGYACGTDIGMVIFNLSADPANPVQTGVYNAHYVHDLHVQHGLAHLAAINDGFYRIVTVPGLVTLDQVTTPGGFPHNTWANADDTIVATTDEVVGGRMTLYDISNPSSIKFLSSMTIDPSVIIHNVFIKGPRAYVSWYVDGLGVIDISDPANPSVVGTYDTNAATGGSFTGAWGCYPFAPSGVIYISDLENGLFILQEDDPPADTIVLTGDTAVRVGNRGTYAWSQAPANSPYWFYLSKKMNGTAVNGHSFDIGPGLKIMKTGTTDAAGAAGFTSAPVRAKFANKSFHVEIRVDSGGRTFDSNSLTINILP